MSEFQFKLQPYNDKGRPSRFPCPACDGKREFTRYINAQTGEPLDERVGICNRQANCGYHYTPKQYFADNPNYNSFTTPCQHAFKSPARALRPAADNVAWEVAKRSLGQYDRNPFVRGLAELLTNEVAFDLARRYHIGTTQNGGTIFWQVDERQRVRTGKIIHYDAETLKRIKRGANGNDVVPQWAHSKLGQTGFNLRQCLFGKHLLALPDDRPVAIVEAEKTAVLCSVFLPAYRWLATGGCGAPQLKDVEVLTALQSCGKVLLFPDTGATDKWATYATEMRKAGVRVQVRDDLDAPNLARPPNWDLADEFLAFAHTSMLVTGPVRWALTEPDGYPIFWDYPPTQSF